MTERQSTGTHLFKVLAHPNGALDWDYVVSTGAYGEHYPNTALGQVLTHRFPFKTGTHDCVVLVSSDMLSVMSVLNQTQK